MPNELADELAKKAAQESKTAKYPCERKELKIKLREMVVDDWQYRRNIKYSNHRIQQINSTVRTWFCPNVRNYHLLLQLVTGQTRLNKHISRIDSKTSEACLCGMTEDADHFMCV